MPVRARGYLDFVPSKLRSAYTTEYQTLELGCSRGSVECLPPWWSKIERSQGSVSETKGDSAEICKETSTPDRSGWLQRGYSGRAEGRRTLKINQNGFPARAYQYGNTIIIENENGEVVEKYEIPNPEMSSAEFIEHLQNMDPKQRIRAIEDSDIPESVKRAARKGPVKS